MKITKDRLKEIIMEEITETERSHEEPKLDEGIENITPENAEMVLNAIQHFLTQPEIAGALVLGGVGAALEKVRAALNVSAPIPPSPDEF